CPTGDNSSRGRRTGGSWPRWNMRRPGWPYRRHASVPIRVLGEPVRSVARHRSLSAAFRARPGRQAHDLTIPARTGKFLTNAIRCWHSAVRCRSCGASDHLLDNARRQLRPTSPRRCRRRAGHRERVMSIGHRGRLKRYRRRSDSGRLPHRWPVWQVRRPVLGYVLAVDMVAVVLIAVTARLVPVRSVDVSRWALLLAGSVIHVEATRGIERLREIAAGGGRSVAAGGLCPLAALLSPPPPLTAALITVTYTHSRIRVTRRVPVYKTVFSAATVVVSCAVAALVLAALDPAGYPAFPAGPV